MRTLKTYLVEDSPIIRENLIGLLEEAVPVKVVGTAADESTARHWFDDPLHDCDLAIVDIYLQGGSGLGVIKAVARLPDRPTRWVVLSNYATPEMRRRCLELGAHEVFDKSNEIESLLRYCDQLAHDDDTPPASTQH